MSDLHPVSKSPVKRTLERHLLTPRSKIRRSDPHSPFAERAKAQSRRPLVPTPQKRALLPFSDLRNLAGALTRERAQRASELTEEAHTLLLRVLERSTLSVETDEETLRIIEASRREPAPFRTSLSDFSETGVDPFMEKEFERLRAGIENARQFYSRFSGSFRDFRDSDSFRDFADRRSSNHGNTSSNSILDNSRSIQLDIQSRLSGSDLRSSPRKLSNILPDSENQESHNSEAGSVYVDASDILPYSGFGPDSPLAEGSGKEDGENTLQRSPEITKTSDDVIKDMSYSLMKETESPSGNPQSEITRAESISIRDISGAREAGYEETSEALLEAASFSIRNKSLEYESDANSFVHSETARDLTPASFDEKKDEGEADVTRGEGDGEDEAAVDESADASGSKVQPVDEEMAAQADHDQLSRHDDTRSGELEQYRAIEDSMDQKTDLTVNTEEPSEAGSTSIKDSSVKLNESDYDENGSENNEARKDTLVEAEEPGLDEYEDNGYNENGHDYEANQDDESDQDEETNQDQAPDTSKTFPQINTDDLYDEARDLIVSKSPEVNRSRLSSIGNTSNLLIHDESEDFDGNDSFLYQNIDDMSIDELGHTLLETQITLPSPVSIRKAPKKSKADPSRLPRAFVKSVAEYYLNERSESHTEKALRDMGSHLNKKRKTQRLSEPVVDLIEQISDTFLENMVGDLVDFSEHAKRKTVNASDAILLMKRSKVAKGLPVLDRAFLMANEVFPEEVVEEIEKDLFE